MKRKAREKKSTTIQAEQRFTNYRWHEAVTFFGRSKKKRNKQQNIHFLLVLMHTIVCTIKEAHSRGKKSEETNKILNVS